MSLRDAATTDLKPRTGPACSVATLEAKLASDPEELDYFQAMMYEQGRSADYIWKAVTQDGHYVGRQTINRHRSRSCGCFQ